MGKNACVTFQLADLLECTVEQGQLILPHNYLKPRGLVVKAETYLDRINITRPYKLVCQ